MTGHDQSHAADDDGVIGGVFPCSFEDWDGDTS